MKDSTLRALRCLADGPTDCFTVGHAAWPERTGRIASSGGGGDYAAQMLLGRLRKRGLVRTTSDIGSTRWELTVTGRNALVLARARRRGTP